MAIHLLTGNDESLLRTAATSLIDELVGDGDRAMMVDEFDGDEYELRAVVDAAQTPPFLTDKRVVVARGMGRFNADDLTGLLAYLENPLDSSDLVLLAGGGTLSPKLSPAVKKAGTVTATAVGNRASDRQDFVRDRVAEAGIRLDGPAQVLLVDWLGENVSQLDGVLTAVAAAYGPTQKLGRDEIEPFLGEAGGLPPWDLTDAIDKGDTRRALDVLGRMMRGGGRHPLQLMSTLHSHYAAIAKLDGTDAHSKNDAEQITGLKGFRAAKTLDNYTRLGGDMTRRAVDLLAAADLDLRGDSDLDDELVMEVLVARLSKLRR
jgi:DNA polymerase-3 subunit delta